MDSFYEITGKCYQEDYELLKEMERYENIYILVRAKGQLALHIFIFEEDISREIWDYEDNYYYFDFLMDDFESDEYYGDKYLQDNYMQGFYISSNNYYSIMTYDDNYDKVDYTYPYHGPLASAIIIDDETNLAKKVPIKMHIKSKEFFSNKESKETVTSIDYPYIIMWLIAIIIVLFFMVI